MNKNYHHEDYSLTQLFKYDNVRGHFEFRYPNWQIFDYLHDIELQLSDVYRQINCTN